MPRSFKSQAPASWLEPGARDELIWAAGFFDGEGTFHVLKGWRGSSVSVPQKDIRPLIRFQAALGGIGTITTDRRRKAYTFKLTNTSQNLSVMNLLWPWLSEPKREQFHRAIRRKD